MVQVCRIASRSFACLALAVAATGCASNAPEIKSTTAPTAFRDPTSIKPEIAAAAPMPAPSASPPVTVAKASAKVEGEWAPPVAPRKWQYIVIHHSASPGGNATVFDREHRVDNGWDELGYHFVIDNGRGAPDGQIEIGPRWMKQKWGAHAKTPDNKYNEVGIGICFVGNFMDGKPTARQMASATRLVAWLMQTYNIPADHVIGHRDTKQTLCPGRNMNLVAVRTMANKAIADAAAGKPEGAMPPTATPAFARMATASHGELLHDAR